MYHHGSPVILSSSFVLSFGAINMLTKKLWEKQFALCEKSSKFSSIELKLIICGAGHASHRKKHINLMLAQTKESSGDEEIKLNSLTISHNSIYILSLNIHGVGGGVRKLCDF